MSRSDDALSVLWRRWYFFLAGAAIGGGVALFLALALPDVYRSSATLAPSDTSNFAGADPYGTIGSLTGLDLGSATRPSDIAVATLRSRSFLVEFARDHDMVVPLLAVTGWDADADQLFLDPNIYDSQTGEWIGREEAGLPSAPTDDEIYNRFREILEVSEDADSGLINVSIEFPAPPLAVAWLRGLIDELNRTMLEREIDEINRSIAHVRQQLDLATIVEIRQALQNLLVSQMNRRMLAIGKGQFALETVDVPNLPNLPSGPNRTLIVIAGIVAGIISGGLVALVNATLTQHRRARAIRGNA